MTLGENTGRPKAITEGTNRLVHATAEDILSNFREVMNAGKGSGGRVPKLWDGKAAERIVRIIEKTFSD